MRVHPALLEIHANKYHHRALPILAIIRARVNWDLMGHSSVIVHQIKRVSIAKLVSISRAQCLVLMDNVLVSLMAPFVATACQAIYLAIGATNVNHC